MINFFLIVYMCVSSENLWRWRMLFGCSFIQELDLCTLLVRFCFILWIQIQEKFNCVTFCKSPHLETRIYDIFAPQEYIIYLLRWNEQHSTGMGYRALGGPEKDGRQGKDFTFSHKWIWSKFTSVVPLLKPPPQSSDLQHIHQPHKRKQYPKISVLSFMRLWHHPQTYFFFIVPSSPLRNAKMLQKPHSERVRRIILAFIWSCKKTAKLLEL